MPQPDPVPPEGETLAHFAVVLAAHRGQLAALDGKVEHLALGGADDPVQGPGARPKNNGARPAQLMKLTRVLFENRMYSNNKDNSRNAKFYDNVEVFHFPAEDPDAKMNPDSPPKDGFYMSCNILNVFTRQIDNKSSQMMVADGNVFFRTPEFFGTAAVVKYDESQDKTESDAGNRLNGAKGVAAEKGFGSGGVNLRAGEHGASGDSGIGAREGAGEEILAHFAGLADEHDLSLKNAGVEVFGEQHFHGDDGGGCGRMKVNPGTVWLGGGQGDLSRAEEKKAGAAGAKMLVGKIVGECHGQR